MISSPASHNLEHSASIWGRSLKGKDRREALTGKTPCILPYDFLSYAFLPYVLSYGVLAFCLFFVCSLFVLAFFFHPPLAGWMGSTSVLSQLQLQEPEPSASTTRTTRTTVLCLSCRSCSTRTRALCSCNYKNHSPVPLCCPPTNLKYHFPQSDSDWGRFVLKICWCGLKGVNCSSVFP